MEEQSPYEPPQAQDDFAAQGPQKEDDPKALIGLVLGALSLICWCFPLAGLPVAGAAVILGGMSLNSANRNFAIAALVLGGIGAVLSIGNALLGAYLGATGQHDLVNQMGLLFF